MASSAPLSADDLKFEVRRRFSVGIPGVLSDEFLRSHAESTNIATAAAAATAPTTPPGHSPNTPNTALESAVVKGARWSHVANAHRFQLAHEAEKVADVAGAAAQLMRLSSMISYSGLSDSGSTGSAGKPRPSIAPAQKRAALLADIVGGPLSGLKHVSKQDKAHHKADPHATMLADIKGGRSKLKSVPKERRVSATSAVRRLLGYGRDEVLAERPTPLGQVSSEPSSRVGPSTSPSPSPPPSPLLSSSLFSTALRQGAGRVYRDGRHLPR